jgi:hypothetical protein
MDVKSVFLNGFINELVYVDQPPRFEDPRYRNHVHRLSKVLYGLKQALRAWYERLQDFLIEKGLLMISYLAQQMKTIAKSLMN